MMCHSVCGPSMEPGQPEDGNECQTYWISS